MKNTVLRLLIVGTVLIVANGWSETSYAQSNASTGNAASGTNKAAGPKKQSVINFDDDLIEGNIKKPELLYLLQKKQFNFKRLIKLRENFLPEMGRTAEEIQRRGDGV